MQTRYSPAWGILYTLRKDGSIISSPRGNATVKVKGDKELINGDLVEVTLDCDKGTLGWIRERIDKEKGKKRRKEYKTIEIEMGETWHPYLYVETSGEGLGADVKLIFFLSIPVSQLLASILKGDDSLQLS